MVELNRAVALSFRDGPQAAIPIVEAIRLAGRLPHSHAVAAVLANLYARAGVEERARRFLSEALERARTPHERELIALQIKRARG
jgi:predicted RNA polymerase sigma factor